MLAFFIDDLIYFDALESIRATLRGEQPLDPDEVAVQSLIDRSTEYVPLHVLGLSRVEPHIVIRIQMFGPPLWHLHLLRVKAPKLTPQGLGLNVKERLIVAAAPRRRSSA